MTVILLNFILTIKGCTEPNHQVIKTGVIWLLSSVTAQYGLRVNLFAAIRLYDVYAFSGMPGAI